MCVLPPVASYLYPLSAHAVDPRLLMVPRRSLLMHTRLWIDPGEIVDGLRLVTWRFIRAEARRCRRRAVARASSQWFFYDERAVFYAGQAPC